MNQEKNRKLNSARTVGIVITVAFSLLTLGLAGCQPKSAPAAEAAANKVELSYGDPVKLAEDYISSYNNREYNKLSAMYSKLYWDKHKTDPDSLYKTFQSADAKNPGDFKLVFADAVDDTHRTILYTSSKNQRSAIVSQASAENGDWRFTEVSNVDIAQLEPMQAMVQHQYHLFVQAFNSGDKSKILPYFPDMKKPELLTELVKKYAPLRYIPDSANSFGNYVIIYDKNGDPHQFSIEMADNSGYYIPNNKAKIDIWLLKKDNVLESLYQEDKPQTTSSNSSANDEVERLIKSRGEQTKPTQYQKPVMAFLKAFNKGNWNSTDFQSLFNAPVNDTGTLQQLYDKFAPFDLDHIRETAQRVSMVEVVKDKNGHYHEFAISFETEKLELWISPAYNNGEKIYGYHDGGYSLTK